MAETRKSITHWRNVLEEEELLLQPVEGKMSPDDYGNYVGFFEGDKLIQVSVRDTKWQNRLEALGMVPCNIIYYSESQLQFREYSKVPISFLKLPSPKKRTKKVRQKRLKWEEWLEMADMYYMDYIIPRDERESAINWDRQTIRVTTFNVGWQNRIESLGFAPNKILRFDNKNAEQRDYSFPREYLKLPSDRSRKVVEIA